MKKILTTLTLFITLCLPTFGQDDYYFGDEIYGFDLNMTAATIVYVDGVLQTDQTIEIAAFIDGELRGVCKTSHNYPNIPEEPFNEYYYREIIISGSVEENGKEITFKAYNHDTEVELSVLDESDDLVYEGNSDIPFNNPLKLYFETPASSNPVAKVGNTEYSNIDDAIANWTANSTLTLLDNVTLSDVVTLKSTEHHILDLGTYTMTAASGKNAIEIVAYGTGDAERSAITINADAINPGGINAGNKSVIYYNYANGGITTNDRPIIKINNGVFTGITSASGNAGIYFKGGSAARQAATLEITGGVFNCSISGQIKSKLRISGGIFNYSVGSQGDSTALRLIWGGTFKSFGYMTADSNNTKFWFGTSMANSNVGLYINDDDYLVVGGAVITEAGEMFEASSANYNGWVTTGNLLQYSSAKENGLYYTDALICLKDNDNTTGSVNIYTDQLDLTSLNYKGTIIISNTLAVTFNESTTPVWTVANAEGYDVTYTDVTENGIVTRTYTVVSPVAQILETEEYFYTLAAAVEAAQDNDIIELLCNTQGNGIKINKSITIDFANFTYTFIEQGVGDTPTKSNGFQILENNNVVLQNGTLNVADEWKEKFYILIQNYSNLTVNNMNLDGTNLDMWSTTDGDSYVLSNNSGNVNIIGSTTITANNDGDKAFAFDACKYANYEAPVVTLGNEVVINGNVELSGGQINHNIPISGVVTEIIAEDSWSTLSVPMVGGADIPEATVGIHDLYRYDEAEQEWEYFGDADGSTFSKLELGRGYLYANTNEIKLSFEGKFNTADVIYPLSYTVDNALAGFNLIGNPFTHNISSANFKTSETATLADGFYLLSGNGEWLARPEGKEIAPMESVLVKVDQPGIALTISKDAAAKRSASKAMLEIAVSNNNSKDYAYVSFNDGLGLDKINHQNEESPMVFITIDEKDYAIAMMNQNVTEIPVSFKAAKMGEYTFNAKGIECQFSQMILIDKLTGEQTNLLLEDYTFIARTGDNPERFIIKLIMANDDDNDIENFAVLYNGEIIIKNIDGNAVVTIIDVLGRPIAEYNVSESANISTATLRSGIYMIQMYDNNGVKVQKVVIE